MKNRVILLSAVLLCLAGCRSQTVRTSSVIVQPTTTQFPGKSALRTSSAETFGQVISQQILADAVAQVAEGKRGPVTVTMKFNVSINGIPELGKFPPEPPEPSEPFERWDFCWVVCEVKDGSCYADCMNPSLSSDGLLRTCDDIWEDYLKCGGEQNPICRLIYGAQLVRNGCVTVDKVIVQVPAKPPFVK